MYYGSPAYFLTIFAAALIVASVYFLFKGKPFAEDCALFCLAVGNLLQHFYKPFVWPHLRGGMFSYIQTAYNVCAFLIIVTPFVLIWGNSLFKQFVCFVGTFGGILPFIVPQWFIGKSIFTWEFLRGFVCHVLLLCTSLLPLLWKKTRLSEHNALAVGIGFFGMLGLVFSDNLICIVAGLMGKNAPLWETMLRLNPLWIMSPPQTFPLFNAILNGFSFGIKCGPLPYVPVLWYFLPMFSVVFLVFAFMGKISDKIYRSERRSGKNMALNARDFKNIVSYV